MSDKKETFYGIVWSWKHAKSKHESYLEMADEADKELRDIEVRMIAAIKRDGPILHDGELFQLHDNKYLTVTTPKVSIYAELPDKDDTDPAMPAVTLEQAKAAKEQIMQECMKKSDERIYGEHANVVPVMSIVKPRPFAGLTPVLPNIIQSEQEGM